jgi:hypothetical protein
MGDDAVLAIAKQAVSRTRGIYSHEKPDDLDFNPNSDVSRMSGAQIARANQYFVGMHAFMTQDIAQLDAEITALEFRRKILKETIVLQNNSGQKKYNVDAIVTLDGRHQKLSQRITELEIQRIAMTAAAKGLENKAAMISRDISRREVEARQR